MSEEMEVAESPVVENDITLDAESHDLPEESAEHQESEQGELENDTASDSSPDIAPEQEKKLEHTANVKKAINSKHRQMKEAQERAEALQKRLDELEGNKLAESTALADVPALPDQFDDDFEAKRQRRESVLIENARRAAIAEHNHAQELQAQQAAQIKQQSAWNEKQAIFMAAGVDAGISEDSILESAQTISNLGLPKDAIAMLVGEEDGAVIMDYLSKNPDLTIELAGMNPYQQGAAIQSRVRNAVKPSKKMTKAPVPPKTANGAPGHQSGNPLLKGATFE
tara:strand:- start:3441 stop:4289 length:849 start_codon:yes stop_codon:yes gene_type:complete